MKTKLFSVAVAAIALTVVSAQAEDKKATIKVDGMMCGSCENAVKKAVTKVDGVKSVEADHSASQAVVTYDPAKVDQSKIEAAINTTKFKVAK